MNYKIVLLFLLSHLNIFSQERDEVVFDTIRKQGYLIIETNGTNKKSDIPVKFLFIPLENNFKSFHESYLNFINPTHTDLFIPTPYVYDCTKLKDINFFLKKYLNFEVSIQQSIVKTEDLLKNNDFFYRFKDNILNSNKELKVFFIDGIWLKVKISKKNSSLFIEEYNKITLTKNGAENYDYFFLIETKSIGYKIDLIDSSIEKVKAQ